MADSNANQEYARYMLRWIEEIPWPEFPLAEAELPALRGYWDHGDVADLAAIEARLWSWVDAHGGPAQPLAGDLRMILARMLICVAQLDNQELQARGYFEELLQAAGVARDRIQARSTRRPPRDGDASPDDATATAVRAGYQRLKMQVLMAFGTVSFVSGATVDQADLRPAWMSLMVFLIFLWYRLDSDQVGFRRSGGLTATVILIAAIGIPWYLVQSRGWERGRVAILQAVGVFLASMALSMLGAAMFASPPV